jgi:hypothetical protein
MLHTDRDIDMFLTYFYLHIHKGELSYDEAFSILLYPSTNVTFLSCDRVTTTGVLQG